MASIHEDVPLEMQRYLSSPINNTLNVKTLNLRSQELLLGVAELIKFFDERYKLINSNAVNTVWTKSFPSPKLL